MVTCTKGALPQQCQGQRCGADDPPSWCAHHQEAHPCLPLPGLPRLAPDLGATMSCTEVALYCEHDEREGAEGPVVLLGRWPVLWSCVLRGDIEVQS